MKKIFILVLTIVMTMTNVLPTIAATTTRQQETTTAPNKSGNETSDLGGETESTTGELLPETTIPEQPETTPENNEDRTTVETPSEEVQEELENESETNAGEGESEEQEVPTEEISRLYTEKATPIVTQGVQTFRSQAVINEFAKGQVNFDIDPEVEAAFAERVQSVQAFEPQSPQPYEVAAVTASGDYVFVEGQATYDAAVEQAAEVVANQENAEVSTIFADENMEIVDAVVLNNQGVITYSTQSNIVRVFKTINGALYTGCDKNTDLYSSATLSSASGYVNQCYVDDVALLGIQGDAAKVLVSGKVAWIRISTDLVFVTPQQVTNPSYYVNENGNFVHFITKNLTNPNSGGSKITIGPANTTLANGTKYYSYDGKYFYTDPEVIGPDMADGVTNQAVNASSPYYNYFLNLPFNSKAVATAAQIDSYINANTQATSKLRNTGQAFIDAQEKYGINAMLMLGIAINESGWGMSDIAQTKNNLFGLNAIDATPGESANYFSSVAQCINDYASDWLAQGYADPQDWRYYGGMLGNKNMGANVKYASDPFWAEKAAAHIYTVDRGINGGNSKEWNYYSIGIFTTPNSVKNASGQEVYPITAPDANGVLSLYSGYTETPIVLKETDSSDGKYLVWPARNNILSSSNNVPTALPYSWNSNEYVNSSGVEVITGIKSMQVASSFDTKTISNTGTLNLNGWLISQNMNILTSNDLRAEFIINDQTYATSTRWQRSDITPLYGGGRYEYPWAGFDLKVDLSSLAIGTYTYAIKLSEEGYHTTNITIPGTIKQTVGDKIITISGSTIKVESAIQTMQPVYSFDQLNLDTRGKLSFSGWMISKNMDILTPNDMKIEFVVSDNGDKVLATAERWQRDDITSLYGDGKYTYPWAGMRLNVDLSTLAVGTYAYHLRLSQSGYQTMGLSIPGIATQIVNGKKITISGSTIKVESAPQTMQPVHSFDYVKLNTAGQLDFYGWMISKNMNILTPNDMKIEFVLSNNGDKVLATAERWQRDDITSLYGEGKYAYPWAGMRLNVDLSSLAAGTYEYHLRLSQSGYQTYGLSIPGTITQLVNGKKITISGSTIKVENAIQTMQPVYSFDQIKLDTTGKLNFYGWMISKNMNILTQSDMKIEFVLSNNGDKVLATAERWQRDDITPLYGQGNYTYPWAGMRLNVDLSTLAPGTYGYHLRLSQPGYQTYGLSIPGTTSQVVNGKKITISGSTVKIERVN